MFQLEYNDTNNTSHVVSIILCYIYVTTCINMFITIIPDQMNCTWLVNIA